MDAVLTVLAVAGFAAAAARFGRALLTLLRLGAESFVARQTAGTRARRGDLTGMTEAEAKARTAARARRRALGALAVWGVALAVPPFTPWTRAMYAAYVGVWAAQRVLRGRWR